MNAMSSNTQPLLKKYGQESPPDPALLFAFPNEIRSGANLYGFQKTYEGTWSVDIFYDSASLPQKLDGKCTPSSFSWPKLTPSVDETGPNLAAGIAASSASYRDRFARTFPLVSAYSASHVAFAQDMMANLIGGVGYFHGSSMVDATATEEEDEDGIDLSVRRDMPSYMTEPRELLAATPSRSFFPRGFYWFVHSLADFFDVADNLNLIGTRDSICLLLELGITILVWRSSRIGSISSIRTVGSRESRFSVKKLEARFVVPSLSLPTRKSHANAFPSGTPRVSDAVPNARQSPYSRDGSDSLHLTPPRRRNFPRLHRSFRFFLFGILKHQLRRNARFPQYQRSPSRPCVPHSNLQEPQTELRLVPRYATRSN